MTLGRFLRLTTMTIVVAGILVGLNFDYRRGPFFVIFFVVMNLYYWLDYKWFE